MCAILGAFTNSQFSSDTSVRFKKALSLMDHRGLDDSVELFLKNGFLGFNRLSIVGASNGSQPFSNQERSIFLLCNGEIYNHQELKKELKNKHKFVTKSDCEIILHLYEEDPVNFANRLRGQFSIVIFDGENHSLVLCRDRFGINPLFYSTNFQNDIFVSSEIKSLLFLDPSLSKGLDPIGLKETLFLYGPTPPRTCFENINQVLPGHVIVFDLKSSTIERNDRYWVLPSKVEKNCEKVTEKFGEIFENAVKRRIQGDSNNPAVYLSGGLDSAFVLSVLSQISKKTIDSFSITFNDKKYDESRFQNVISKFIGNHQHRIIGDNLIDKDLSQTIWHTEHPLVRTAPIPLYSLSQKARLFKHKYVLCGEGADELLLGYPVFFKNRSSIEDKITEYSAFESLFLSSKFTGREMVYSALKNIEIDFKTKASSIRHKQLVEIFTKLSRYLLVSQGDRQSMSHSVEQRFPFLDEDLIDFIFSLPDEWFRNKYMGKLLLKDYAASRNLLPDEILFREKQGYLAPMVEQIYDSSLLKEIKKTIVDTSFEVLGKYFNKAEMKRLFKKLENKSLSETEVIAVLFIFSTQILYNHFFDRKNKTL